MSVSVNNNKKSAMNRTVIDVKSGSDALLLKVNDNKSLEGESYNSTVQQTKETPMKAASPEKVKFTQPKVKVIRSKTPLMHK